MAITNPITTQKNAVTHQNRHSYKKIFQSNATCVNYKPSDNTRGNKGLKYTQLISLLFTNQEMALAIVELITMSMGKVYYDPKLPG